MKSSLRPFLTLAALCSPVLAQPADSSPAAERTQWFREARFGMFIHWGVYAVPAGEWNGETIKGIGEWIMRFRTNPHFPALRSDSMALSGASRRKQSPSSITG